MNRKFFVNVGARPKSTTCFLNILEKKMAGGETACFAAIFYLDTRGYFVLALSFIAGNWYISMSKF